MGPGLNMQNVNENFSQDFKNRSEMRPEMINNRSQPGNLNATINGNERPGPGHAGMEGKNNSAKTSAESDNKITAASGFLGNLFGRLIDALRSLFS
jgi:hypothetical protein